VFFVILDGKPAEGQGSMAQSYVATLSHFFGLAFRTTLGGALAVAFTQYLWRLLRSKAMEVSSTELLFKVTSTPLLLTFRSIRYERKPNSTFVTTFQEHYLMSCVASRTLYNITVTYSRCVRNITHSETYLVNIKDKAAYTPYYSPNIPACDHLLTACSDPTASKETKAKACIPYAPANWSQPLRGIFTAYNGFALIDALISPLGGNYTIFPEQRFVTGASSHYTCGIFSGA
jgi:hypothetical protein